MDFSSPGTRRLAALGFGAAVPGVLLGSILLIGHSTSRSAPTDDDRLGPVPTQSGGPTQPSGQTQSGIPTARSFPSGPPGSVETVPPGVTDFQTDSNSGYANNVPSTDLFGCAPVAQTPRGGSRAALVTPPTCRSRPTGR